MEDAALRSMATRAEGQDPVTHNRVNEAYDNLGTVLKFLAEVFNQDSVDNRGRLVLAAIDFGESLADGYWDMASQVMVFGAQFPSFWDFTELNIVAHEFMHGVIS